jgi:hypothetical protein
MKQTIAILVLVLMAVIGCQTIEQKEITDFEECVEAGNPIMESYPRQCSANGRTFTEMLIGGERDEHGCLGPAGYSWNKTVGACIREWELDESQRKAAKRAVESIDPVKGTTVTEVEVLRCPGCFNVKLELGLNAGENIMTVEIVNWEVSTGIKDTTKEDVTESTAKENVTTKEDTTAKEDVTESDALRIAQKSGCGEKGTLADSAVFNENSNTWWIDLEMKPEYEKQGCSPACVVDAASLSVDINWRCTGLIQIDPETACENDEDCACGVYIATGECFFGNKEYVNTEEQCPDYCTGIAGNIELKCIENECMQLSQRDIICEDLCGDGICQEIVCMAEGCPCPESSESCPQDCG